MNQERCSELSSGVWGRQLHDWHVLSMLSVSSMKKPLHSSKLESNAPVKLISWPPLLACRAQPRIPPASTLAHGLAVMWRGDQACHVGLKGTSSW